MKHTDVKNAELALCITLHTSVENLKPGRLKNLLEKLSKESQQEITKIKKPSIKSMGEIKIALDKFSDLTGWGSAQKHLQTYVSAISLIIEKRGYKRINSILVDINDYQARHKNIAPACYWSAEGVADKWEQSFKTETKTEPFVDYKGIDSRMQKKEQKRTFAEPQGFSYWSKMVHKLHDRDEMSPVDIVNHILNSGFTEKITVEAIRNTLRIMGVYIKRSNKVKTKIKKVYSKPERPCRRCKKKEIPPEHSLFCHQCYADNCRRSSVVETYSGGSQYLGCR